MKIFIALAATAHLKGDRVVVKFGNNQWYTGSVASIGKKITVLFDDGEKHAYELGDTSVKGITSKRKSKAAITNADAKLLYSAPVATPKARTPRAATPAKTAEPKVRTPKAAAKPVASTPEAPKANSFVGSVVKSTFGPIVVLSKKYGCKYAEFKWSKLDNSGTGWLKFPVDERDASHFVRFPFIRDATPKEMSGGRQKLSERYTRISNALQESRDKIKSQKIQPGDVVKVTYSSSVANEAVLEVNYRTGKVAIVRSSEGAASYYSKKRYLPIRLCEKIADGGGKFDPNNPIYAKYNIYIPQFYKSGNTVAPNRNKARHKLFGLSSNFNFSTYMPPDVVVALEKSIKAANEVGNASARTYANAMAQSAEEYGKNGLSLQISYMLLNLGSWKGEEARAAKKILNKWAKAN